MVDREEHIPEAEGAGAKLEILEDGRVGGEALLSGFAKGGFEDGVGRDAFFFDEAFYLCRTEGENLISACLGGENREENEERCGLQCQSSPSPFHSRGVSRPAGFSEMLRRARGHCCSGKSPT